MRKVKTLYRFCRRCGQPVVRKGGVLVDAALSETCEDEHGVVGEHEL